MDLDYFLKVIEANLQTKESLQEVSNKKIKEVLTGGPEEFKRWSSMFTDDLQRDTGIRDQTKR